MYEWLRDYQKLIEEIDYLKFKLEQSQIELKRWVEGDLQNVPLKRESIAANLEESIKAIKKEIVFKKVQRDKLLQLVNTFKGLDHKILKMKYVEGLTLEVIAEELNYSAGYIYKKHAQMMKMVKFVETINLTFPDSK